MREDQDWILEVCFHLTYPHLAEHWSYGEITFNLFNIAVRQIYQLLLMRSTEDSM